MAAAPRLYLVIDRADEIDRLTPAIEACLATGMVACLRLDLGPADEATWVAASNALQPVAHGAEVPLLLGHEASALVPRLGLDGVHLGPSAPALGGLRKTLGRDAIIGGFAGHTRHAAMSLAEAGADYVALGPLHGPEPAADDLFAWWAEMIETPVVAEGGVSVEDAARLADTVDFLVPDPAIWADADPPALLARYAAALTR